MPVTEEEWKKIASDFGERYQFFNCLGALDGKHVAVQKPAHSGSLYYNYKLYFSIVLMALVNANKEFIMIDVGTNGRVSDGGVLFYTKFWELFEKGDFNIPDAAPLPNTAQKFPHVIISDGAFALGKHLMKPYPQNACNAERVTFNYRLSRARQVVEGAFGIFGVFQKAMCFEPSKAATIVSTCCYLHNFLLKTQPRLYLASNWTITNKSTEGLLDLAPNNTRNTPNDAKKIRENFCQYFSNEGKLDIRKNVSE